MHYHWKRVALICDPASSTDPFYQQICAMFETGLKIGQRLGYTPDALTNYAVLVNLSTPYQREMALKEARLRSRSKYLKMVINI